MLQDYLVIIYIPTKTVGNALVFFCLIRGEPDHLMTALTYNNWPFGGLGRGAGRMYNHSVIANKLENFLLLVFATSELDKTSKK